jgi:hypothetical protein
MSDANDGIDFEATPEDLPLLRDSGSLADYEGYVRRVLPGLVRVRVEERAQPLETSLLRDMDDIVRDCLETLFREYSDNSNLGEQLSSPDVEEGVMIHASTQVKQKHQSLPASPGLLYASFQPPPEGYDASSDFVATALQEQSLSQDGGAFDINWALNQIGDSVPSLYNISSDSEHGDNSFCDWPSLCLDSTGGFTSEAQGKEHGQVVKHGSEEWNGDLDETYPVGLSSSLDI